MQMYYYETNTETTTYVSLIASCFIFWRGFFEVSKISLKGSLRSEKLYEKQHNKTI